MERLSMAFQCVYRLGTRRAVASAGDTFASDLLRFAATYCGRVRDREKTVMSENTKGTWLSLPKNAQQPLTKEQISDGRQYESVGHLQSIDRSLIVIKRIAIWFFILWALSEVADAIQTLSRR